MPFSHKIKRLLLVSIAVIVLALAANDGIQTTARVDEAPGRERVPYPYVPLDIDPSALDRSVPLPPLKTTPSVVPVAPRPAVSAESYLVAHLGTGEHYAERDSTRVFPIASLSKLVTALVALRHMSPGQKVTITQPMLDAYGEAGHFTLGETFTVSELMYPLLLESSNDAAEALAQSYGYANFITQMNGLAAELGMTSTSFRDASGLSSGNISTAQDLLLLARHLYVHEKPLLELTRQTSYAVASSTDHGAHIWNTINPFPYDPHFIGGKTGRTIEAKESMVSLFHYDFKEITYPVVVIVLRSDFSVREADSSYLFGQFIRKIEGR